MTHSMSADDKVVDGNDKVSPTRLLTEAVSAAGGGYLAASIIGATALSTAGLTAGAAAAYLIAKQAATKS